MHGAVHNAFNFRRHLISRSTLRISRAEATTEWRNGRMTHGQTWLSMGAPQSAVTKPAALFRRLENLRLSSSIVSREDIPSLVLAGRPTPFDVVPQC